MGVRLKAMWHWRWRGTYPDAPPPIRGALRHVVGDRVVLRSPRPEDVSALLATMDDEFRRVNGWTDAVVRTTVALVRSRTSVRAQPWAVICDRDTGEVIGSISATGVDRVAGSCELGWWLGPRRRALGYGTEAVSLAIAALHSAGVRRVLVGTSVDNFAVQRIAGKVGAVEVRRGEHRLPDGSVIASVWFAHDHT